MTELFCDEFSKLNSMIRYSLGCLRVFEKVNCQIYLPDLFLKINTDTSYQWPNA